MSPLPWIPQSRSSDKKRAEIASPDGDDGDGGDDGYNDDGETRDGDDGNGTDGDDGDDGTDGDDDESGNHGGGTPPRRNHPESANRRHREGPFLGGEDERQIHE